MTDRAPAPPPAPAPPGALPPLTPARYAGYCARIAKAHDHLAAALVSLRGLPPHPETSRTVLSLVNAQHALHRLHDAIDQTPLVAGTLEEIPEELVDALVAALRPN